MITTENPVATRLIQIGMKERGFYSGAIDGIWGPVSERAFRAVETTFAPAPPRVSDIAAGASRVPGEAPGIRETHPMHAALSADERARLFGGPFRWRPKPEPGNREAIEILDGWEEENIVSVELPGLRKIGNGGFHRMRWNKRCVRQLVALWDAWDRSGLLKHILTYDGSFVARTLRGSSTSLSDHAYGTAFDLNCDWNGLGELPAKAGTRGSVRELVPLAHAHGFYWGGHFTRLDGMHFEVCKIL
jgi:hypothetical protein